MSKNAPITPPSRRRRVLARANRQQMAFELNAALRNDERWGALLLEYVRGDSEEDREAWRNRSVSTCSVD